MTSRGGYRLGTLCAIDTQPRQPIPSQIAALQTLASIAADALAMDRELKAINQLLSDSRTEARERSLFVASFSHELRTPLNHIGGFSEIIENDTQDSLPRAKCREYAAIIRRSAQHLFQVIDGIVRLEKAAYGADLSVAPIDVDKTLGDVVRSFEAMVASKRQRLEFRPSGCGARVPADETALRQIAVNLISNACKYSPEGAAITVTAFAPGPDDRCFLEVADTGPGIADDLLHRIGEAFVQDKNPRLHHAAGIGLGLRISMQLAKAMHCDLKITRGAQGGTIARLEKPR